MWNGGTGYAFWTMWGEAATHFMETYLKHIHKKHQFMTMVIYELLSKVNKQCDLKTPDLVNKDVVEGTKFTPFFLDDKSDKVYIVAKAIA